MIITAQEPQGQDFIIELETAPGRWEVIGNATIKTPIDFDGCRDELIDIATNLYGLAMNPLWRAQLRTRLRFWPIS